MLHPFHPWPVETLKEWWPQKKKTRTVFLTSWPWVRRPSSQIQSKQFLKLCLDQQKFRYSLFFQRHWMFSGQSQPAESKVSSEWLDLPQLLYLHHADPLLGIKAKRGTARCFCVCVCAHTCTYVCAHAHTSGVGSCLHPVSLDFPPKMTSETPLKNP